jgi:hypothetical protein
MTSSANQQANQQSQQTVIENIDQFLDRGMPIYDMNDQKIGDVKLYSIAAGYLMVEHGAFEHNLYLPFRLIRSIDPHEIYLNVAKDGLEAQYGQPPAIKTEVETRLVPGPHGVMTQQTQQVQTVESGYDQKPTALNTVDATSIADQLAVGMIVFDVTGVRLGDITQFDIPRSLMVVEKGLVKPSVLFVPFSAIKNIDRHLLSVDLSLPKDVLQKEHSMLSAGS